MPSYHIKNISYKTFQHVLSRYPSTVPEKLLDLDVQRYETIPSLAICEEDGSANLTKDMTETLVEWKLKHGTFRPKLLSLVQSNDAETVLESITKAHNLPQASIVDVLPALKILTQLKGVGPATASLLLSVLNPTDAPFFSDELFRWCCWDEPGGGGWKRGIKYTAKEYVMVVEKVMEIRRRLGMKHIQAVHVEKVAWVLGKEGIDVDKGEDDEEGGGKEDEEVKEMVGTKRKAGDEDILVKTRSKMPKKTARKKDINSPAAGARRSTRTKK